MLFNGSLNAHLEEIDNQAEETFDLLMEQIESKENVTEKLMAENQLRGFRRYAVRSAIEDVVLEELIYN